MVPAEAVRGATAAVFLDAGNPGADRGVRAGSWRREVRDAALQVHVHQREGEEERTVLLARMADVGGGGGAACVAEVQAPEDPHVALLHTTTKASVAVLLAGGGEASALYCAVDVAQAGSR